MKKIESTLTNMVLVLVGLSLVIAALLAWVNNATATPIAQKAEKTLADGIKQVMRTGNMKVASNDTLRQNVGGKEAVFVIHRVESTDGKPMGAAVESSSMGFGGDLKVLVGFDKDGVILGYTILQSSETPGLGAKADTWFQKDGKGNIIGRTPGEKGLSVTKDGGEVDAITASTITSRAFLKAVNSAYNAYTQQTDAVSGATTHHHTNK